MCVCVCVRMYYCNYLSLSPSATIQNLQFTILPPMFALLSLLSSQPRKDLRNEDGTLLQTTRPHFILVRHFEFINDVTERLVMDINS